MKYEQIVTISAHTIDHFVPSRRRPQYSFTTVMTYKQNVHTITWYNTRTECKERHYESETNW